MWRLLLLPMVMTTKVSCRHKPVCQSTKSWCVSETQQIRYVPMHQAVLPRSNLPTISFAHQSTLPDPLHGLSFRKISNQKFHSGTIFSELKKGLKRRSRYGHFIVSLTAQTLHQVISIVSIELTATNYVVWKIQILHLIESLKVAKYSHQEPSAEWSTTLDKGKDVPNSAFDQRKEQDRPRSGITGTLSEVWQPRISGKTLKKTIFKPPRKE